MIAKLLLLREILVKWVIDEDINCCYYRCQSFHVIRKVLFAVRHFKSAILLSDTCCFYVNGLNASIEKKY